MSQPEVALLQALFDGDGRRAVAAFAGRPDLDVPVSGRVEGADGVAALAAGWGERFGGTRFTLRNRVVADGRAVAEVLVDAAGPDGPITLPAGIVADLGDDGRIEAARVYYADGCVSGSGGPRPSPFGDVGQQRLGRPADMAGVHRAYLEAVAAWDADAVMRVFAPGAYIEIGLTRIDDRAHIRGLYESLFGNELKLVFSTITDDGAAMALEWVNVGDPAHPAGLAVYGVDGEQRLASLHLYENLAQAEG